MEIKQNDENTERKVRTVQSNTEAKSQKIAKQKQEEYAQIDDSARP